MPTTLLPFVNTEHLLWAGPVLGAARDTASIGRVTVLHPLAYMVVNFLMSPLLGHRCPDICVNVILGVSICGCFWRLTFIYVD